MNYGRFINSLSSLRKPSLIRELTKILSTAPKEMIALSAGMPNPDLFPFTEIQVQVMDSDDKRIRVSGDNLKSALQYQPTNGLPTLVQQIKELQHVIHNPPSSTWKNSDVVMLAGSQDGLCKSLEMMLEPQGQSSVICEDFIYTGTLAIMDPYQPHYHVVQSDGDGMIPEYLVKTIENRDLSKPEHKFLYICPTGANPTGTILSEKRRKQIYEICCKYDLLILEDDPYYYLQFTDRNISSFFSMDVDGRVLRFDSFSKILSSGIRLGFVTGPKPLTDQLVLHMQASVLHASSLSQVITSELLQHWGKEGFLQHVQKIKAFYKGRRDKMNEAAEKHLSGLCTWNVPQGGMFLWIKVDGIDNTWDMIMQRAQERNIMLLPGKAFQPLSSSCSYLRAAYSLTHTDNFDVAFQRLAQLIKEEK